MKSWYKVGDQAGSGLSGCRFFLLARAVPDPAAVVDSGVVFATETEEAFAALLDALGLEWEYEPHEFVLETKENGRTQSGFRPDFYLPERDLYIEVTAAKILTGKNRKVRILREQFPQTRIALVAFSDRKGTRKHLRVVFHEGEENESTTAT